MPNHRVSGQLVPDAVSNHVALELCNTRAGWREPSPREYLVSHDALTVWAGDVGLLTAARPKTIEGVSGIMNLAMFPMWIGSGVFFSIERFPAAAQPFLRAIPLTALNDALRAVMLEGTGIVAVLPQLANLAIWGGVSFFVALRIFRWQ